jgi:hypothetical protein
LAFEKAVDGHDVTPLWYRAELVRQVEAEQIVDNTRALVSTGAELYRDSISKTLSQEHPWLAAAVISREWEYWHKVEGQLDTWAEKWSAFSAGRRIEGLPWPAFDIEALRRNSNQRKEELLKLMSQQNMLLALFSRPEGFPDYAGQFLHTTGEVAFDTLITNHADLLKNIFKLYLVGCLVRFDNLRPKLGATDWRAQQEFKVAAAALLDVMNVSGYAKLLADYHGNESLWSVVVEAWNGYLAQKGDQSPMPLLAGAVALTETAFEIPHRGILRTTWQQKIARRLADVPRHDVFHRGYLGSDTVVDHTSALVRIFAQEPLGSFHDGLDIFIAFYLRNLEGAKDLDFGWKRRDLQESLDMEERRKARNDEQERQQQ